MEQLPESLLNLQFVASSYTYETKLFYKVFMIIIYKKLVVWNYFECLLFIEFICHKKILQVAVYNSAAWQNSIDDMVRYGLYDSSSDYNTTHTEW